MLLYKLINFIYLVRCVHRNTTQIHLALTEKKIWYILQFTLSTWLKISRCECKWERELFFVEISHSVTLCCQIVTCLLAIAEQLTSKVELGQTWFYFFSKTKKEETIRKRDFPFPMTIQKMNFKLTWRIKLNVFQIKNG